MDQPDIIKAINTMYKAKDYHGIIAATRDVSPDKIKDRRALEMIGDSYDKSGLYEDAREAYLVAFEKYPQSRSLAYKLALISVKIKNLDDAVEFYEDFCRIAPNDNNRYIIKYIIGRAGGIETKDLIRVLEQYNEKESDERWLYELARLYHDAGRADECVALCDEIALWYADGEYEKAALELKFMHKALSKSQQARYEQIMSEFVDQPEEEENKEELEEAIELEKEAEIFVNEFSQADDPKDEIFEEVKEDKSIETFTLPIEKIAGILKEEEEKTAKEGEPEDTEKTKIFTRTELGLDIFKFDNTKEEPAADKSAPKEAPSEEEKEQEEEPADEEPKDVMVHLLGSSGAKVGISHLKLSPRAALVKKPTLSIKDSGFVAEPKLKETVDTSDIPIANEQDGQIGINLVLIDKNREEEIEGQITIDEFFEKYAGKVADNKDEVAAVEAERLRQIVESVKDMEPTPLYDMSFNTPDSEEFSEEEIITFVDEDEETKAEKEEETAQETDVPDIEIEQEELSQEDLLSEEPTEPEEEEEEPIEPEAEEPAEPGGEEAAPDEEWEADTRLESFLKDSVAEVMAQAEKEAEAADAEAALEAAQEEEPASEEEALPEEAEAEDAEAALEAEALPEEGGLDDDLAQALAKFEEAKKEGALSEDNSEDLFGFGDDLADMIGVPDEEEEQKEEPLSEPVNKEFVISDEFRNELKEFLLIDGIEEEIRQACQNISDRKRSGDAAGGNLIITGDKKSGKTYLAIAVIKAVIKEVGSGSGKVVKVQAQPLNGKDIGAVLKKVEGRDLIIENVGYLKDETIRDLIAALKGGMFSQMVVLEGNMLAIENILVHFPEIRELFASRIDIQELTITQWAEVAKKYALDQGYVIDAMAELALHARIDKINVPNARLGLGDIKDIVDSAIAKASKKNNGKLFAAFSKKSKGEIVLTESDFAE